MRPYRMLAYRLLTSVRSSINVLWLVIIAGYFMVLSGQAVYHNYQTERDTQALRAQVVQSQVEQQRLQSLLLYYNTSAFKEKEMRRVLLLKKPNEKVYALPESNQAKDVEDVVVAAAPAPSSSSQAEPIWRQWVDYLLHKKTGT